MDQAVPSRSFPYEVLWEELGDQRVLAKDARSLAPQLYTDASFIEAQGKGSFAAHIRGVTKHAVPLTFSFGYLEGLPVLSADERASQRETMRI